MGATTSRPSDAWPLTFREDFHTLNRNTWQFMLGNNNGWGNGEKQTYTADSANAAVKDGTLRVTLRRDANGAWTSARMTTRNSFTFTFGRIDVRLRTSRVDGPFPAVWALSTAIGTVGWPLCGEIDIFEMQTKWPCIPASLHFGARYADNPVSVKDTDIDPATWHVYSMEWTPHRIAFFHDGRQIGDAYDKPPNPTKRNWPFDGETPFYLIINNAIHPSWGTEPQNLESHVLEVDYIHFREYPMW